MKLTPQREVFAGEIAKGKTRSEAYRLAFPHSRKWQDKSVWSKASKLAGTDMVQARVSELMERGMRYTELTVERVLLERKRLALFDVRKMFDSTGKPKPIHELDDDTAAAVAGLDVCQIGNDEMGVGEVLKVKLADKNASLTALERHLGMYASDDPAGRKAGVINIQINLGA